MESLRGWRWARPGRLSWFFAGVLALAWNLHGVATNHPYQAAFFNAAVGGLGGAQQKSIPFACDYWLTSYREAARWLREDARAEKRILVMRTDLMRLYLGEEALVEDLFEAVGRGEDMDDAYVVFVPRSHWRHMAYVPAEAVRRRLRGARVVHRTSRQAGEILTIYRIQPQQDRRARKVRVPGGNPSSRATAPRKERSAAAVPLPAASPVALTRDVGAGRFSCKKK